MTIVPKLYDGTSDLENGIATWIRVGSGLAVGKVIWSDQQGPRPQAPYVSMLIRNDDGRGMDWLDTEDNPLVFSPLTVTSVDPTTDQLAITAHGLLVGDGPVQVTTTGALPAGLALVTDYWAVPVDAGHLRLATSLTNANAGVYVDLTTAGTGVLTLSATAKTLRAGAEVRNVSRGARTLTLDLQCFAVPSTDATGVTAARAILGRILASTGLPKVYEALVAAGLGVADWGKIQSTGGVLNTTVFEPRAMVSVTIHVAAEISETGGFVETVTAHGPSVDITSTRG